jgi:hypothetical protein
MQSAVAFRYRCNGECEFRSISAPKDVYNRALFDSQPLRFCQISRIFRDATCGCLDAGRIANDAVEVSSFRGGMNFLR